jgi:hypothetical protein
MNKIQSFEYDQIPGATTDTEIRQAVLKVPGCYFIVFQEIIPFYRQTSKNILIGLF